MRFLFTRDTWQEIFGSIRKNKGRTIVTIIGVLWGIFIYITLSGAAKGMDNGFEKQFENTAMNSMFVWAEETSIPYDGFKTGRQIQLKYSNADLLKRKVPAIQYIAPRNVKGMWGDPPAQVVYKQRSGSYAVYGDFPVLVKIAAKKIYDGGRFLNQNDVDHAKKVCVIGERTRDELFGKDDQVLGEYIKIGQSYFKVIGIHKYVRGGGFESDSDIYIPFTTFKKMYNSGETVGWFAIAAYEDADVLKAEEDVKRVLKKAHRVDPKDEQAFGSFNFGEIFSKIMGFAKGMGLLSMFVGIATIVAGVIGIGNILLISVKERTRELGIRRALGATPGEVRGLIILESVFLTIVAGVIGIVLGALVLSAINAATQDIDFPYANPTVPFSFVFGSLALMVVLGTLIGLIPAQRAVSIRPIEALREE